MGMLLLTGFSFEVLSQCDSDTIKMKVISEFLDRSDELRRYDRNAFTTRFSGKCRTIPPTLQERLARAFPNYHFFVATMEVLIDPPSSEYDLIVFYSLADDAVRGFIWADYWMLPPSKDFETAFVGTTVASHDELIEKAKALGELIVFPKGDKLGSIKPNGRKVSVELRRGEGVHGRLTVSVDRSWSFQRLVITDGRGRKLRFFV